MNNKEQDNYSKATLDFIKKFVDSNQRKRINSLTQIESEVENFFNLGPSLFDIFDNDGDDWAAGWILQVLKKFINEIKQEFKLSNNQICLSGFSQGCMMSLNVGLTFEEKFLCIVGFSGKIINLKDLKIRIKNNTETLLIHGEADQIVSSTHLLEAKDFLIRNNVKVDTLLIKNCDHHIPIEASSTALNFILKKI